MKTILKSVLAALCFVVVFVPGLILAAPDSAEKMMNLCGMQPPCAKELVSIVNNLASPFVNNTWMTIRNAANNADINVLKVDGSDETYVNADSGDSVHLSVAGTSQVEVNDGALIPTTDDDIDLGSASKEFKDLYVDGTATVDALANSGASTLTGAVTTSGDVILDTTGKTIKLHDGTAASACMGTATLNGTTAVTVSTTCAATGARIFATMTADPTATDSCAFWVGNIVNGTSFDIDSDETDCSATVNWLIIKDET